VSKGLNITRKIKSFFIGDKMCIDPMFTTKDNKGNIKPLKNLKYNKKIYDIIPSQNIITIKCGKCEECRKEKMLEMKTRLKEELKKHKEAFFLTLTYDEEHKKNLNKRDIQLFLKRLRKDMELKYFYVGELGEETKRPHYHMIIFGEIPKDLEECINTTKKGHKQYKSKKIEEKWQNGIVRISKMELPLIGYICKYMLKNCSKKEFISGWSRKPPIGINPETIEKDIQKRQRTKALKKYYKKRFGEIPKNENEEEEQKIKIENIEKNKIKYIDYLRQKRGYK
jgi:hypothetical protein